MNPTLKECQHLLPYYLLSVDYKLSQLAGKQL